MDPKLYELVISNSSIKTVTLNYFLDLLRDNKPATVVKDLRRHGEGGRD